MTEMQKHDIEILRQNGFTYSYIAERTQLNLNTIKTHCFRNGIKQKNGETDSDRVTRCKHCGKKLVQATKTKPRKYCGDDCRHKYWAAHRDLVKPKAEHFSVCAYCGRSFHNGCNTSRKFCSHPCYIASRFNTTDNQRKEEKEAMPKSKTIEPPKPAATRKSEDELAYRLIKIMLGSMVSEGLITKSESESVRKKAVLHLEPLIGSLEEEEAVK